MASSIPGARTALFNLVTELSGTGQALEGVGVYRTGLWEESGATDRIVVLNATGIVREWVAIPFRLEERYTLPVAVTVYRTGRDIQAAEDRLWAVVAEIERAVLNDYTLGGAVRKADPDGAPDGEQSGPTQEDPDVILAQVTIDFACMWRGDLRV